MQDEISRIVDEMKSRKKDLSADVSDLMTKVRIADAEIYMLGDFIDILNELNESKK